jgi:hypothetical protein
MLPQVRITDVQLWLLEIPVGLSGVELSVVFSRLVETCVHICNLLEYHVVLIAMEAGWKRILWTQQPFADNFVPASFLDSLLRNGMPSVRRLLGTTQLSTTANVHAYDHWSITLHTCTVSQQLSAISVFSSIFILLLKRRLDPRALFLFSVVAFLVGFRIWENTLLDRHSHVSRSLSMFEFFFSYDLPSCVPRE